MPIENTEGRTDYLSPEEILRDLEHLPVAQYRELIREQLRIHPNFVLVGETGSGKTTCLPLLLLELRDELGLSGRVGVTQPRRIAASSISSWVSKLMNTNLGDRVGYNVRFDNQTSENTEIVYMTDGILLRQIQFDPFLTEYSIIMVDEAHEGSKNIHLCLGLLKQVNRSRLSVGIEPIRLIVTSATIDQSRFADFLSDENDAGNCVSIPGNVFPVTVHYEKSVDDTFDYSRDAANKVKTIVESGDGGDILIFVPGVREINQTIRCIEASLGQGKVMALPLHAGMTKEEQDSTLIQYDGITKVVVATNIAEASLTIDGIVYVIDSGLIKEIQYDPRTGIEQLVLVDHALSGLRQRLGRAGRTREGVCYRQFTKNSMSRRLEYQTPEIVRTNLAQTVLNMKVIGIDDVEKFDFLDHPGREVIRAAVRDLKALGALDRQGDLTEIGRFINDLSLEPRLGRMVVEAARYGPDILGKIVVIAAFLDGKDPFIKTSDPEAEYLVAQIHNRFRNHENSDFGVILNIWRGFEESGFDLEWATNNYLDIRVLEEAAMVQAEIASVLKHYGLEASPILNVRTDTEALGKAITAGLVGNLLRATGAYSAEKNDGTQNDIHIQMNSIFYNKPMPIGMLFVANEIFMNPSGKLFASGCLSVKPSWLREVAPNLNLQKKDLKKLHRKKKR